MIIILKYIILLLYDYDDFFVSINDNLEKV